LNRALREEAALTQDTIEMYKTYRTVGKNVAAIIPQGLCVSD